MFSIHTIFPTEYVTSYPDNASATWVQEMLEENATLLAKTRMVFIQDGITKRRKTQHINTVNPERRGVRIFSTRLTVEQASEQITALLDCLVVAGKPGVLKIYDGIKPVDIYWVKVTEQEIVAASNRLHVNNIRQANTLSLHQEKIDASRSKAEHQAILASLVEGNINCIFVLEDVRDNNRFSVHLRRFASDAIPILPNEVERLDGDSAIGAALLQWKLGAEISSVAGYREIQFHYRVISRTPYNAPFGFMAKRQSQKHDSESDDIIDLAKRANGHLAREENRWGSYPMHESNGDESTGNERDFEDWAEYSANYSE